MAYSSNSFANGSNPNNGNVLSERSSTRRTAGPGGNSTIVLGSHEAENVIAIEDSVLTARSSTRVAPGGNSSIGDLLGGEAPSIGGEVTGKLTSNSFACGSDPNAGNVLTDRPTTHVRCAPGGASTIGDLLGCEAPSKGKEVTEKLTSNSFACGSDPNAGNVLTDRPSTRVRCAPGGESSIADLLGCEAPSMGNEVTGKLTSNSFANGANPNSGNVLTERSSTRLHCPPGGESSIMLGGNVEERMPTPCTTRIAPGGKSTICLGGDTLNDPLEVTSSVNRIAPGGVSTIVLGGGPPLVVPEPRTFPGGVTSVILGDAPPAEQFSHRVGEQLRDAPEPTARFPFAPGGNSTFVLGASDEPSQQDGMRVAPGGPSTIVLGEDTHAEETPSNCVRIPPGGETTILLGEETSADRFFRSREVPMTDVPDPTPRFPCAPGGNSSIDLGDDVKHNCTFNTPGHRIAPGGPSTLVLGGDVEEIDFSNKPVRTAPGGESTILLGEEISADRFAHRADEPMTSVPDPTPRFPFAPGGNSTIMLHTEKIEGATVEHSGRIAPGGTSSIVLGGEVSPDVVVPCTRGPVGGESTLVLGEVGDAERFGHCATKDISCVDTPAALSRFPCAPGGYATINLTNDKIPPSTMPIDTGRVAPGGKSSVILGGDMRPDEVLPIPSNGVAPGGKSTVMLGTDTSAERFSHRTTPECIDVPDPTPRFPCAPGGRSTVVLGNCEEMKGVTLTRKVTCAVADENVNTVNILQSNTMGEKIQASPQEVESIPVVLG